MLAVIVALGLGPEYTGKVQLAGIGVRGGIGEAWKANRGSFLGSS